MSVALTWSGHKTCGLTVLLCNHEDMWSNLYQVGSTVTDHSETEWFEHGFSEALPWRALWVSLVRWFPYSSLIRWIYIFMVSLVVLKISWALYSVCSYALQNMSTSRTFREFVSLHSHTECWYLDFPLL